MGGNWTFFSQGPEDQYRSVASNRRDGSAAASKTTGRGDNIDNDKNIDKNNNLCSKDPVRRRQRSRPQSHSQPKQHVHDRSSDRGRDRDTGESTPLLTLSRDETKPPAPNSTPRPTPTPTPTLEQARAPRKTKGTVPPPVLGSPPASGATGSLLLRSLRHWEVALPPVKKHVVGGELVETFRGSLYGSDARRRLPAAKRRLTVEVYGPHDERGGWGGSLGSGRRRGTGRRRKRAFPDPSCARDRSDNDNDNDNDNHNGSGSGGSARERRSVLGLFGGFWAGDSAAVVGERQATRATGTITPSSSNSSSCSIEARDRDAENNHHHQDHDHGYELGERDIVILRVMKPRLVNEYDDAYGFGLNSISGGLKDREWESQSMSDRTMAWMVDEESETESGSHSWYGYGATADRRGSGRSPGLHDGGGGDDDSSILSEMTTHTKPQRKAQKNIQWIEVSRTRLSQAEIVRRDFEANEVDLEMGVGPRTVVRTLHFGDGYGSLDGRTTRGDEAWAFARLLDLLKRLQAERARRLADRHRGLFSPRGLSLGPGDGVLGTAAAAAARAAGGWVPGRHTGGIPPFSGAAGERGEDEEGHDDDDDDDEEVNILVEIVSASNLSGSGGSHGGVGIVPRVVVRDGNTDVHSTGRPLPAGDASACKDPIWTLSTGSLCLLRYTGLLDFFERSNVLEFSLKTTTGRGPVAVSAGDDDREEETIGTVMVHKTELLGGNGERKPYQVLRPSQQPEGGRHRAHRLPPAAAPLSPDADPSVLYLRYRKASPEDIAFVTALRLHKQSLCTAEGTLRERVAGVYACEVLLAPKDGNGGPPAQQSTTARTEASTGEIQHRVRPGPDPENASKTTWMTGAEMKASALEHSRTWVLAGSGSIGRVYVEILRCEGLSKNKNNTSMELSGKNQANGNGNDGNGNDSNGNDSNSNDGNKNNEINPFVCLVYEDSLLNTDVIHGCSSPIWMPWSQRAFVLNTTRPCSQLFLGVLDRGRCDPKENDRPLGRAVVSLTNLRPGAINTLTYALSDGPENDAEKGSITIRLRIKMEDERRALLSEPGFSGDDHYCVAANDPSDYSAAVYSLGAGSDPQPENLFRCLEELFAGCSDALDSIADAMVTLLLWRGHCPVTLTLPFRDSQRRIEVSFRLPLHSMVAFAWAIALARDFQLVFSFLPFSVGWALLATMEEQRRHPSPWRRPRSYRELLRVLLFNKSRRFPLRTIRPNERLEETERFDSAASERAGARRQALERWRAKRERELGKTGPLAATGEDSALLGQQTRGKVSPESTDATATSGNGEPLVVVRLLPLIRAALHRCCVLLRISRSIVSWRDSYAAFWIATMGFLGSFVALWIPWGVLVRWGWTVLLWTLFGPWMKLVDLCLFRPGEAAKGYEDDPGTATEMEERYERRYDWWLGSKKRRSAQHRIHRENTLKTRDAKRYMFGKYLTRVPIWKEERFPSKPAISSSSVPYNAHPRPVNIVKRIHGQRLTGDMVPRREYNYDENYSGSNYNTVGRKEDDG